MKVTIYPLRNISKIPRYDQKKAILEYKRLCKKYKGFLTQQELKDKGYVTLERFMRRTTMVRIIQTKLKFMLNRKQLTSQKGKK